MPIHFVAGHYYLYDTRTIATLRAEHHVLGTPIGTLPQANQQNIFSGLPLLLLPEEARLLCEKGLAFVVDDAKRHAEYYTASTTSTPDRQRREAFQTRLDAVGRAIGGSIAGEKAKEREAALKKMGEREIEKRAKRAEEKRRAKLEAAAAEAGDTSALPDVDGSRPELGTLASPASALDASTSTSSLASFEAYSVTPMLSSPPLPSPAPPSSLSAHSPSQLLPAVPSSYPLYRHLHEHGYFMHPGLRFGCQYMAYPGDPLRFHSHFLVVARGWHERVKLSTLVGLGRLGTGVKKGFLVGGVEEPEKKEKVRCFSIEWSGM